MAYDKTLACGMQCNIFFTTSTTISFTFTPINYTTTVVAVSKFNLSTLCIT